MNLRTLRSCCKCTEVGFTVILLVLPLLFSTRSIAQSIQFDPIVSTLAGSGAAGRNEGQGIAATFSYPAGIAVDGSGNVYVADQANHKIRKITPQGRVSTLAGTGNADTTNGTGKLASFNMPYGVALDAKGNVYVADLGNHTIRKITPDGMVSLFAGTPRARGNRDTTSDLASFWAPRGVAVDNGDTVYVADGNNNKIRKITPDGIVRTLAGSGAPGSVDRRGTAASFNLPYGIAVHGTGTVYVAEQGNSNIRKITSKDSVSTLAGSTTKGNKDTVGTFASFNNPHGVVTDMDGNVYVADSKNHRIRKITPIGIVSTFAGTGATGTKDGTSLMTATFAEPNSVAIDLNGNLYVSDVVNNNIRKISKPIMDTLFTSEGTASKTDTFYVSGASLSAGMAILVPDGFEISFSGAAGYAPSQIINPIDNKVPSTPVFIRLSASATAGLHSGEIKISSAGALAKTLTVKGTVVPLLTAPVSSDLVICYGQTAKLTTTGSTDGTLSWYSLPIGGNNLATGPTYTTSVLTSDTTYYVQDSLAGRVSPRTAVSVTINPLPNVSGTLGICPGSSTTLTGSVTPIASLPWSSAETAVATVNTAGLVTGVSAGTSVITYTDINSCTKTVTVTVSPLPTISGTLSICEGATTTLTGSGIPANINPWVSGASTIATVGTDGLVTGVSAGTSVITYTDINSCIKTAAVTVSPLPTISGTLSICEGATTTLTGSGISADINPWVSGVTTIATIDATGVVTGVSAGTSVITYTDINGCTKTVTVTVSPLPTISGALSICEGATTTLTGSGIPADINPWVSGVTKIGTINTTGLVTGVSAGTSVITYTDINSCTKTVTVTVSPLPTVSGTLSICEGATTTLTGSGIPANINPWVSGASTIATVGTDGLVTGVSAGTSVITYTDINSCIKTAAVTVSPVPTISGTLSICEGATTTLTGSGISADINPWVPGVTTIATIDATGVVTGVSAGISVITYTDINGCTKTVTVTVSPLPTISGTLSICEGATTTLTGAGIPADINPWVSGVTTIATINATGLLTGVSAGTSVITYTDNTSCKNTANIIVNAKPTITSQVIPSNANTLLTLCNNSKIILTASGPGSSDWTSKQWYHKDVSGEHKIVGAVELNYQVTYPGEYWILAQSSLCSSKSNSISILPSLQAAVSYNNGLLTASPQGSFTYQWYVQDVLKDKLIVNFTDYTLPAYYKGNYYVAILDAAGCLSTSEKYTSVSSGFNYRLSKLETTDSTVFWASPSISDISDISIKPNPAIDFITVHLPEVENKGWTIKISDLSGRILVETIMQEVESTISLSNLSAGTYYLRAETENGHKETLLVVIK